MTHTLFNNTRIALHSVKVRRFISTLDHGRASRVLAALSSCGLVA